MRVVVTGIGTINPIGHTVKDFWDGLREEKQGVRRIRNIDTLDCSSQIAGEIDLADIDLKEYFKTKHVERKYDRYIIFGHIAGTQAVRDSGLDIDASPERCGSLIGTGDAGIKAHNDNIKKIHSTGMHTVSPYYITNAIPNTGSAYFAQNFNLQGPSFSVNSACATGNHAIGVAASLIKMGLADVMFTGGSEAPVNEPALAAFDKIMALSTRNDSPETASRPFDRDRDGFVLGEGAGVVCVEELEHAKRRGARIYAEITGYAFSCDAHDLVAPDPEARGAARAIREALDMARLNPSDIGLINCHATSTPLGDTAEGRAINAVFGSYGPTVPVHSTKSMVGHLLGGASAVEAIAAILILEEGVVHSTVNQFEQDPNIDLNVVKEVYQDGSIDHILSNSFGFGGQNAVIILSRFKG